MFPIEYYSLKLEKLIMGSGKGEGGRGKGAELRICKSEYISFCGLCLDPQSPQSPQFKSPQSHNPLIVPLQVKTFLFNDFNDLYFLFKHH